MRINLLPPRRSNRIFVRPFAVLLILMMSVTMMAPQTLLAPQIAHAVAPTLTLGISGDLSTTTAASITYTFSWSVTGSAATNVLISATLPKGLTFVLGSTGAVKTDTDTGSTITWNLGNKNALDVGTTTLTTTVAKTATNGTSLVILGTISSTEVSTPVAASISSQVSAPILAVTARTDTTTVKPGTTVTYTATVANTGSAQATNVVLSDTLPAGLTFVDGGMTTKSFPVGTIVPNASVSLIYKVLVADTTASGTYTDNMIVTSNNAPDANGAAVLTVEKPVLVPVVSIAKTTTMKFANPGDIVHYTITINNSGTGSAMNLRITDTLPSILSYTDTGSSKRNWSIEQILPGETRTIMYTARVANNATAGKYKSTVTAKDDGTLSKKTTSTLEVRIPKVKGATTDLPSTGAGAGSYATFSLGLMALLAGIAGVFVLRRESLAVDAADIPHIDLLA